MTTCVRPSVARRLLRGSAGVPAPARRALVLFALAAATVLPPGDALAIDPPHLTNDVCGVCHIPHNAPGGTITAVAGNANLCMSCHTVGGTASSNAFSTANQALPFPGLLPGQAPAGTSHRWDAGPAGHVTVLGTNATSTGTLLTGGAFTGVYAKVYLLTITNAGSAGAARFNWTATSPGGAGTNVLTGTNVVLNEGVTVTFVNGTGTPFQVNDQWSIHVRPDLRAPTNTQVLLRLDGGLLTCSACHDVHYQGRAPFDTNAPAYGGGSLGDGRHYMRITNDTEQLCNDCHAARVVTNASYGSHPVGIAVTTGLFYRTATRLPLEKNTLKVRCLTCHAIHFAPANDGDLLRLTNSVTLCVDCHRLADTNTPAAHLTATNALTLWPGGQYGSTFPQRTNTYDRGTCMNCHNPHGWPNATNTAADYPKLMVELEERTCFTCHDSDGPAVMRVKDDYAKAYHHPTADEQQMQGRSVECTDCHNAHRALAGSHSYTTTATATRNRVSNPLKGVSGVAINFSSLTNFQAVATNLYTFLPRPNGDTNSLGATNEYQICLKCHSGYAYGTNPPPAGLTAVYTNGTASFTNGSTAVAGVGTAWNSGFVGLWIRLTNSVDNYLITNVASATSLRITPPYAGATVTGRSYLVTADTDCAQEFSPANKSGHPVVIGLDSYTNSTAVGGKRGLLSAALTAPWNVSIGTQTMMCVDCHDATTTTPGGFAQGPHGSANQFILRGPNAANWPSVTLNNYSSSWCANCHPAGQNNVHSAGDHSGYRCYNCHIVVPHGGRMSRLIGDQDTMPARYAYNNTVTNMQIRQFTKATRTGYSSDSGNCNAACTTKHRLGSGENW